MKTLARIWLGLVLFAMSGFIAYAAATNMAVLILIGSIAFLVVTVLALHEVDD